jgi:hypothetical protein
MTDPLPARVVAFRVFHGLIAAGFISCVAVIYYAGITGSGGRKLAITVSLLAVEGTAVMLNAGNCPMAGIQGRMGDQTPFFELFLPPRVARLAVPFWFVVTAGGLGLVALRPGSKKGR